MENEIIDVLEDGTDVEIEVVNSGLSAGSKLGIAALCGAAAVGAGIGIKKAIKKFKDWKDRKQLDEANGDSEKTEEVVVEVVESEGK